MLKIALLTMDWDVYMGPGSGAGAGGRGRVSGGVSTRLTVLCIVCRLLSVCRTSPAQSLGGARASHGA